MEQKQSRNSDDLFFRVYLYMMNSGLYAALGKERIFVLFALAKYMDQKGECYPTMETLAKDLGVTIQTVNKYIQSLLAFRWKGEPLVSVRKNRRGPGWVNNVYTIHPNSQIAIFNEKVNGLAQ